MHEKLMLIIELTSTN